LIPLRDPVSSASHLLMALIAVVAALFLVRITRGEHPRRLCALVFGACTVVLYSSSGLFHALRLPADDLRLYQKLDMSAIYLMIAGTATPIVALLLRGRFRVALLVGEWAFAVVGIAALWLLPKPAHAVMVGLYLAMGWLGTAGLWHYWKAIGWRGMAWAMAGAAFYTGGAVIELANWPVLWSGVIRSHELLHLCDIGGTACHLVFIARFVLPYRAPVLQPVRGIGKPATFAVPAEA
jgi:hemolysin III